MSLPLEGQVRQAWSQLANHFTPVNRSVVMPTPALEQLEDHLRAIFYEYFGEGFVDERFALPEDYRIFLRLANGMWRTSQRFDMYLYDAKALIDDTTLDYSGMHDEPPEKPMLWLNIGNFAGSHALLLCCDRLDPDFGVVLDCHDDRPWGDNVACVRAASSFIEFLRKLRL